MTQTVALGFAFGGQSQLLSNPMLLNGPYGGRPAAIQMTKPPMTATVAQSRIESLLMSNSAPPQFAASFVVGLAVILHPLIKLHLDVSFRQRTAFTDLAF